MTLEIFPLSVGDLQLDTSFVNWQTDCGVKNWYPTTAWLIKGAETMVLVDTSFRSTFNAAANQELAARRDPEQEIAPQLGRFGVTLIDQLWPQVDVLDGEFEPVPGIRCVPMPGHTPGHQAIYVVTSTGSAFICGDQR